MNAKLTKNIIKDMCGNVSFKRGDSFVRSNKVTFQLFNSDTCKAIVHGADDFNVSIKATSGKIQAVCSCPKLASFQKDCQHVAAVLLAIYEHQLKKTSPHIEQREDMLADELMSIFDLQPKRKSAHQRHFENREVRKAEFVCRVVEVSKHRTMLVVEMSIDGVVLSDIHAFLLSWKHANAYTADNINYNPETQCFIKEADAVLGELLAVAGDENVYLPQLRQNGLTEEKQMLLLPPSSWPSVRKRLTKAPYVEFQCWGEKYQGLHLSNGQLPLTFQFEHGKTGNHQLSISGMTKIQLLPMYDSVVSNGTIYEVDSQDIQRLAELKGMLEQTGTNHIPIRQNQAEFFLEKVAPNLRKLGSVHISSQFVRTPLLAKLYLDRVNNRLLASLEFHYGSIMLNPVESRDVPAQGIFVREEEKENEILRIMEKSSFAQTESGYILYNEELEYEFLYNTLPELKRSVQIYATTAVRNRIFKGNSFPKFKVKVKKDRINWLEFKFEMDGFPEREIKELLSALEEKRKYYRLQNGSLLSLQTREFEKIQQFLRFPELELKEEIDMFELPFTEGLSLFSDGEQGIIELDESMAELMQVIRNPERSNMEVPEHLQSILKEYQKTGFKWMKTLAKYGFGGILADDMGLGKTLQSITFIASELPAIRKDKKPVLIVCPSSLTYNWLQEIMKFASEIQAVVIDGAANERKQLLDELDGIDVVITSYPLIRKDIKWYATHIFHTVFFDEAQAFKNAGTQTAKAVKQIHADNRFALTGTPVENSIEELWSLYYIVFPQLFRSLKEYANLTRKQIAQRIKPFLLRRLKEDVLMELPGKEEWEEAVDLLPEQKKLYGAYLAKLRHDTFKHLDKATLRKNRIRILAGLTRLRQICCHPALFVDGYNGKSSKLEQLMQLIEESKQAGRRVLIFSQFTKMLELIGRELAIKDMPFFYLDGNTPSSERVELCHRYNAGERDYFLISLKAGGTGLNLMTADTVILYDTWWNPAVEEQAADRAHRIGQENVVQVIKLMAKGTIEEKIHELQEKKRLLVDEIINTDEAVLSSITDEELRSLLL